jgi:hypothetical protein
MYRLIAYIVLVFVRLISFSLYSFDRCKALKLLNLGEMNERDFIKLGYETKIWEVGFKIPERKSQISYLWEYVFTYISVAYGTYVGSTTIDENEELNC